MKYIKALAILLVWEALVWIGYYLSGVEFKRSGNLCGTYVFSTAIGLVFAVYPLLELDE